MRKPPPAAGAPPGPKPAALAFTVVVAGVLHHLLPCPLRAAVRSS
jgi:hypothetical protein